MTSKAPALLLAIILSLTASAIALIAWDAHVARHHEQRSRDFQQVLRGLGLGSALTLSSCEFSFDPRVFPNWRTAHFPIVCSEYFCPRHTSAVFYLRPVEPSAADTLRRDEAALRPISFADEGAFEEAPNASLP